MQSLINSIKQCRICESVLPHRPRPVLAASASCKIAIIGQAPGSKVHASGIAWDDQSGKNLREWMNIDSDTFYNDSLVAIVPMGFCYPGKGKSGDLPPRPECAKEWHQKIFSVMPNLELVLLIGKYAQDYYLENNDKLTDRVKNYEAYLPKYFVLPHPSPRNNIWQAKKRMVCTRSFTRIKTPNKTHFVIT